MPRVTFGSWVAVMVISRCLLLIAATWARRLGAGGRRNGGSVFLNLSSLLAAALPVVLEYEGDFVALVQGTQPCGLESRGVDEDILGTIFGGDEPKTFCAVEELNRAGNSHNEKPFPVCVELASNGRTLAHATQVREKALDR